MSKLKLTLNTSLIKAAKRYVTRHGKSLPQEVADSTSVKRDDETNASDEITPIVRTLKGLLENSRLSETDYRKHIKVRHLKS